MQISDDICTLKFDIAPFVKSQKFFLCLDFRVIMQNCKIGTSTLMTSSSDVAWKMSLYRVETSAEVCNFQI